MEEAAFIEPALFNEVIVPLLGVEGTAVLAITTPEQDLDNYFTILMDLKDPETGPVCVLCGMEDVLMTEDQHDSDEDLFKTIRLGLACEACVAAGKGAECTHMAHLAPPWKSASRQSKMREVGEGHTRAPAHTPTRTLFFSHIDYEEQQEAFRARKFGYD